MYEYKVEILGTWGQCERLQDHIAERMNDNPGWRIVNVVPMDGDYTTVIILEKLINEEAQGVRQANE